MQRARSGLAVLGVVVLVALVLMGIRINQGIKSREQAASQAGLRPRIDPISVQVEPVSRGTVEEIAVLSGSLEPCYRVDVSPRRAGRLASVAVEVGQRVKPGDILAVMEHDDLLLQEQQSLAGLAASRGSLKRAQAQRDKVQADYERIKLLYEERAATQQELKNVQNQLEEANIQLDIVKAQLDQAEANYALLQLQLSQAAIEASVEGVVMEMDAVPGSQVGANSPLVTIAGIDPIEVVFFIPERDIGRVSIDQELNVYVDAFPDRVFPGTVARLGAGVEPRTRTLQVRGRIPNKGLFLCPGMFARVELVMAREEEVLTIPREALMTSSTGYYVFVAKDGKAHMQTIRTGLQGIERVQVIEGLQERDAVITIGQQRLQDGRAIRVIDDVDGGGSR
ncbi:MAG: efflux RND transporter periplasmic adaptor subunit [Limnochordia bacterium]|jgi:RND family efflux transporter MFP subunit